MINNNITRLGKDIITGSAEEDVPIYEAFRHFWEPDNPQSGDYEDGLDVCMMCGADFNCQSSYKKNLGGIIL